MRVTERSAEDSTRARPVPPTPEELARAEARIRDLEAALEISQRKLARYEDRDTADLEAQARLLRSERRFSTLIEQLHVGVVVQGRESEILLDNARARELLGRSEEDLQGRSSFDASWQVIREDGTPFRPEERPVAIVLTTRVAVHGVVMGIRRPRGDLVWLLVDALPEFGPNGEVLQVISTLEDISERKKLEGSLQQAQKLRVIARQVEAQLGEGLVSQLEVLEAERSVLAAEQQLLLNRQLILSATVELYQALGGGWPADVVQSAERRVEH